MDIPLSEGNRTLLDILQRKKVLCIYGKRKHANAASRKHRVVLTLSIALMFCNALLAVTLGVGAASDPPSEVPTTSGHGVDGALAVVALIAAVIGGTERILNYSEQVPGHRRLCVAYGQLASRLSDACLLLAAGQLPESDAKDILTSAESERARLDAESSEFPTADSDYRKAKKSIEDGEESYTRTEREC